MNGSPNHKVFNDFTELFGDSVAFYEAALATEDARSIITNTKLSILLGVFALEAAANSLIFSMELNPTLSRRVERFSFWEKLHVFLEMRDRDKQIDEASDDVRRIREIIKFRNNQVHPKLGYQTLLLNDNGTLLADEIPFSKILRLPEYFYFLKREQAIECLRCIDLFLERFLLETASLTAEETTRILCHRAVLDGFSSDWCYTSERFNNSHKRFADLGLQLKYIDPDQFNANFVTRNQ